MKKSAAARKSIDYTLQACGPPQSPPSPPPACLPIVYIPQLILRPLQPPIPPVLPPIKVSTLFLEEYISKIIKFLLNSGETPRGHCIYTMFHGTSYEAAEEIIRHGFRQSEDGMLGRGVYVSRDIEKAKKYPLNNKHRKVVLQLRVNVGKVKKIICQNHPLQKTWHDHGYDTAWAPPDSMNPSGQEEDCVYDPRRIDVIDIALGNPDDVPELKRLIRNN